MEVQLVGFDADGQHTFVVPEGVTIVGRHLECDYTLASPNVSRRHFRLTFENGACVVKDLGSSNGTFINEKRIHESPLKPGDKLRAADINFTVVIDGQPAQLRNDVPQIIKRTEHVVTTESTGIVGQVEQARDAGTPAHRVEPENEAANDPLSALAAMSRQRQH